MKLVDNFMREQLVPGRLLWVAGPWCLLASRVEQCREDARTGLAVGRLMPWSAGPGAGGAEWFPR